MLSELVIFAATVINALIVVFTNFRVSDKVFVGNDMGLTNLYINQVLNSNLFAWYDRLNNGFIFNINFTQIPYLAFCRLIDILSLNNYQYTTLSLTIYLSLSTIGMYLLLKKIFHLFLSDNPEKSKTALFLGSLLYTFNIFSFAVYSQPFSAYILVFIVTPFLFLSFIKFNTEKFSYRNILAFVVFAILSLTINLAHTIVNIIIIILLFIYFTWHKQQRAMGIRKNIILGLIVLLATSFVTLPMIAIHQNPYSNYSAIASDQTPTTTYNSKTTKISNLFYLGEMTWLKAYSNQDNFKYYRYYFVIITAITFSVLLKNKIQPFILIIFVILITGFFFAKGFNPPFQEINKLFYERVPIFVIFRNNYDKLIVLLSLCFAILFTSGVINLTRYITNIKIRWLFYIALFAAIMSPFFIGNMPQSRYLTKVPVEYQQLRSYISTQNINAKTLVLPGSYVNNYLYLNWYFGVDIYSMILDRETLDENYIQNINHPKNVSISNLLNSDLVNSLGVGYVLVDCNSVDEAKPSAIEPALYIGGHKECQSALNALSSNDNYSNIWEEGNLHFFKALGPVNKEVYLETDPQAVQAKIPTINYTKINPTLYEVKIYSAHQPFRLILNQNYNDNWALFTKGQNRIISSIFKNNSLQEDAAQFNKNTNSWIINPQSICHSEIKCFHNLDGTWNFQLDIEYWPQEIFYFGALISAVTLLIIVVRWLKEHPQT